MSKLAFVLLLALGLTAAAPAEEPTICPPAELLAPCTCSETLKAIDCSNIIGRFNLKAIFDAVTPHIDPSVVFNSLNIYKTSLIEIASNSIETLKFLDITIASNANLEYIYDDAFGATKSITRTLAFSYNALTNVGAEEDDIFKFIRSFPNLETLKVTANSLTSIPSRALHSLPLLRELNMDGNNFAAVGEDAFDLPALTNLSMYRSGLTVIPDNGFGPLPELQEMILTSNEISSIGKEVFARSPKLSLVSLKFNALEPESFHKDWFLGVGKNTIVVDLSRNNKLMYLVEESFKPFLDNVRNTEVGGVSCNRNGCFYQYLTCDEHADWICQDLESYSQILEGFVCPTFGDVWKYCATLNK